MAIAHAARLDEVYGAIADPTRRAILAVLAGGEANVWTLVDRFPLSFNGVSKHVKVLERAGLVERTIHGREHRRGWTEIIRLLDETLTAGQRTG
jgi:DNA-binding transcriptional ArsR family regulator